MPRLFEATTNMGMAVIQVATPMAHMYFQMLPSGLCHCESDKNSQNAAAAKKIGTSIT